MRAAVAPEEEIAAFRRGDIDAAGVDHRAPLRMAYLILERHSFPEALLFFTKALEEIVRRAGVPDKFNLTITAAFLALVAERMTRRACPTFDEFLADNADLGSPRCLARWYDDSTL